MTRLILCAALVVCAVAAAPPARPAHTSAEANRRILELLNCSETFGPIEVDFERISANDQPTHLTHERIHGGIQ